MTPDRAITDRDAPASPIDTPPACVVAECRRCGGINAFVGLDVPDYEDWVQRWFERGDTVRRGRVGEVVRMGCTCNRAGKAYAKRQASLFLDDLRYDRGSAAEHAGAHDATRGEVGP